MKNHLVCALRYSFECIVFEGYLKVSSRPPKKGNQMAWGGVLRLYRPEMGKVNFTYLSLNYK